MSCLREHYPTDEEAFCGLTKEECFRTSKDIAECDGCLETTGIYCPFGADNHRLDELMKTATGVFVCPVCRARFRNEAEILAEYGEESDVVYGLVKKVNALERELQGKNEKLEAIMAAVKKAEAAFE